MIKTWVVFVMKLIIIDDLIWFELCSLWTTTGTKIPPKNILFDCLMVGAPTWLNRRPICLLLIVLSLFTNGTIPRASTVGWCTADHDHWEWCALLLLIARSGAFHKITVGNVIFMYNYTNLAEFIIGGCIWKLKVIVVWKIKFSPTLNLHLFDVWTTKLSNYNNFFGQKLFKISFFFFRLFCRNYSKIIYI
jgi:hypothetical protein